MGYKCTPQLIGLVRGQPKPGQKHRANGGAILRELGEERYSASPTLDRSRSARNEYTGYRSGGDCWAAMEDEAARYKVRGRTKDGKDFVRSLRSDAVVGISVIYNPPHDMAADWTVEDYQRFYRDSQEVMAAIEPRLFRPSNVRMMADHADEGLEAEPGEYGRHRHAVYVPRDGEGRYCGNLEDARLRDRINQEYPRMMRDRGWDLDDLDITDWERYKTDPEYQAERQAKRRKSGRSVADYARDEAVRMAGEAGDLRAESARLLADLRAERDRQAQEAARMAQERAELARERQDLAVQRKALSADQRALRAQERALLDNLDLMARDAQEALQGAQEAERQYNGMIADLPGWQQQAAARRYGRAQDGARKSIEGAASRVVALAEEMAERDAQRHDPTKLSGYGR